MADFDGIYVYVRKDATEIEYACCNGGRVRLPDNFTGIQLAAKAAVENDIDILGTSVTLLSLANQGLWMRPWTDHPLFAENNGPLSKYSIVLQVKLGNVPLNKTVAVDLKADVINGQTVVHLTASAKSRVESAAIRKLTSGKAGAKRK